MSITDIIVSLRMPAAMVEQLKEKAERKHYLDVSELVRGLVRQHWLSSKDPVLYEVQKLRLELKEEMRRDKIEKR